MTNSVFQRTVIKANQDLRDLAKSKGVMLWQIGDALGMNEPKMSRTLRRELSSEQKAEIKRIINQIKAGERA